MFVYNEHSYFSISLEIFLYRVISYGRLISGLSQIYISAKILFRDTLLFYKIQISYIWNFCIKNSQIFGAILCNIIEMRMPFYGRIIFFMINKKMFPRHFVYALGFGILKKKKTKNIFYIERVEQ